MYYRKVMCSDRQPEKEGEYVTNVNARKYFYLKESPFYYINMWWDVQWWLEEIELPSEGEKTIESLHYSIVKSSSDVFRQAHEVDFIAGMNKAIELIKGGK